MRNHKNRHTLSEILSALLILLVGGIVIVGFVLIGRTRQQNNEQPLELFRVAPTETQRPLIVVRPTNIDMQVVQPAVTATQFPSSQLPDGDLAPDFELSSLNGETVRLSDFVGQPVLVNFWASWCVPCRYEMPELVRIYETYQDEGLIIIAINMTFQDDQNALRDFVDEFELPFPVLLDEDGEITNERYGVLGVPMTFFIKSDGRIDTQYIGAMSGEQLDILVANLMISDDK